MRAQNIAGTGGKARKDKERIRKQIKQGRIKAGSRRGAGSARKEEDGPQFSTGGLIHVDIESVYKILSYWLIY